MRGRKHVDLPQIQYPVAARQEDLDVACAANAREHEGARAAAPATRTARTLRPYARRTLKPKLKVAKAFLTTTNAVIDLDPRDIKVGAKVDAKVWVGLARGVQSMAKVSIGHN